MRTQRTLLALFAAGTLLGCSTDLDINAPYQENTVVYALLNMRDPVHFVKINKTFLGAGDATIHAGIPDSNEYGGDALTRALVHRVLNGDRVETYPLRDTLVTNREPGLFNHPQQRLYYFRTPPVFQPNGNPQINSGPTYLHQNSTYELDLEVKGKNIKANAPVVNDFTAAAGSVVQLTTINLVQPTTQVYVSPEIRWNSSPNGKRYDVSYRFHYAEISGADTVHKSFTQRVGSRVASSPGNEVLSLSFSGELFFSTMSAPILAQAGPSVDKRLFRGLDFLFTVANDEFHTYLSLSEPVSGIVEDRPDYTNLENGYGLFASRYNKEFAGRQLSGSTLNELYNGQYTATLRFGGL